MQIVLSSLMVMSAGVSACNFPQRAMLAELPGKRKPPFDIVSIVVDERDMLPRACFWIVAAAAFSSGVMAPAKADVAAERTMSMLESDGEERLWQAAAILGIAL